MRVRIQWSIRAAMGIVCAGGAAHADTSDDIKNASQVNVNYAQVTVDGQQSAPVLGVMTKPAGTLTFDLPASALGIPLTGLSLHAIGAQLGNGQILFTTSNTYDPPVALPDGSTLSSETGMFTVRTWSIGGAAAPACGSQACVGGTGYRMLGGTMIVNGSFGTKALTLDDAHGVGGVSRAKLTAVTAPPVHLSANGTAELPFCSGASETHALMKIDLGSPAPTGGSRVDLTSPTSGIRFSHSLVVPQGRDTVTVDVGVPAGFTGTLSLTAAAGGYTNTASLAVNAASTCAPPPRRYTLEAMANCAGCSAFGALNNEGDRIVAANGLVEFAHAGKYTQLVKLWNASAVGADAINDAGQIAGRITIKGMTQAYRADMLHGAHQPLLLGQMIPMAITQGGVVVGYRVDPTTGNHVPVIDRGSGIVDIRLSSPHGVKEARALFMTQNTTIVGTYTGNDNIIRGYRFRSGTTTTLPMISGSQSIPVGVAGDGSIAVNAGQTAALISPTGAVTPYGLLRGYTHFIVKDINKWGYAVGTATCSVCTSAVERAFVYVPGAGFTALSGYVSNLAYADDALAINDDNQIAIHGGLNSLGTTVPPPDYYLLSL
jgi:hypothetical protein